VTRRLYAEGPLRPGERLPLDETAARHARVLRLGEGDEIALFDGSGTTHAARVIAVHRQAVEVEVGDPLDLPDVESPLSITVAQGLARAHRIEQVIQHGTELGVTSFVPVRCARTQPGRVNLDRWRTVAREAARQCGRAVVPPVEEVWDLGELLEAAAAGLRLVLQPAGEGVRPLQHALPGCLTDVWVLVGPEGGLDPDEVTAALTAGFIPVTLGPRTLRTETAALAAVSALQFARGDWR